MSKSSLMSLYNTAVMPHHAILSLPVPSIHWYLAVVISTRAEMPPSTAITSSSTNSICQTISWSISLARRFRGVLSTRSMANGLSIVELPAFQSPISFSWNPFPSMTTNYQLRWFETINSGHVISIDSYVKYLTFILIGMWSSLVHYYITTVLYIYIYIHTYVCVLLAWLKYGLAVDSFRIVKQYAEYDLYIRATISLLWYRFHIATIYI